MKFSSYPGFLSILTYVGVFLAVALSAAADDPTVSFFDETATRLTLPSFPMGPPEASEDEKDIAAGDFDKDGDIDFVVVTREQEYDGGGGGSARIDYLFVNTNGHLTGTELQPLNMGSVPSTAARDVVAADFDQDTWLDLVIVTTEPDGPNDRVLYYRGVEDGAGNWLGFDNISIDAFKNDSADNFGVAGKKYCAVTAGDIDGDTDLDLFLAQYLASPGSRRHDVILINTVCDPSLGCGQPFDFENQSSTRLDGPPPGGPVSQTTEGTGAEFHDMNGDTYLDIVESIPSLRILYNDGTGHFTTEHRDSCEDPAVGAPCETHGGPAPCNCITTDPVVAFTDYMVAAGDYDKDSKVDLFAIPFPGQAPVRLQRTKQIVSGKVEIEVTPFASPRAIGGGNTKVADFDQDSFPDVGMSPIDGINAPTLCGQSLEFGLFMNSGGPEILEDQWAANNSQDFHMKGNPPFDFAFEDIDGDGWTDIFMGLCDGYAVFTNTAGEDRCSLLNGKQTLDADEDGFGNLCDGDFDKTGVVTISDFNIWKKCNGKNVPPAIPPDEPALTHDPTCAESDMDGSTVVTITDFNLWNATFNKALGPSLLDCAEDSPHPPKPEDGQCPLP